MKAGTFVSWAPAGKSHSVVRAWGWGGVGTERALSWGKRMVQGKPYRLPLAEARKQPPDEAKAHYNSPRLYSD